MGARGPIPNRSGDYSRDRDANAGDRAPITKGVARPATIPNVDKNWHPISKRMWKAMKDSGQAAFFQSSDWAYAYSVMDDLSEYKKSAKRSSMMFAALDSALARLLVTEGDRRRVRLELEAPEEPTMSEGEAAILEYQARLTVVPN